MINRLSCNIGRNLSVRTESSLNCLVTGAAGRLGQTMGPMIQKLGMDVFGSSREISTASQEEMRRALRKSKIKVIVNAAVVSEGDRDQMQSVNVKMPLRLAKAAKDEGIPFIQLSTTATQIHGIGNHTPYAATKLQAEEELMKLKNVKISRLDALIGDRTSSKIHVGHMAGIGSFLPISIHLKGGDNFFQPVSYNLASFGLANMSLLCAREDSVESIPSIIHIAGDSISISDFVRELNQNALELHISPEELLGIAEIVQNGSLTPEFLHLAMHARQNPTTYCNADFKRLLGNERLPSPIELAKEMSGLTSSFEILKNGCDILSNISDKRGLAKEIQKLISRNVFFRQ